MMEAKPSLINKLLFLHWPDPQIFGPSVGPITNLNIFILKTDAVKKDTKHSSNALLSFLLNQSLHTLYVH